jgi:phosphopantothenoylcysteine decarboxylase/phosphopantothenate--cysteine ligase
MAKMATGLANDLASAVLLARDCPVLLAPAMNPAMWSNSATQRNYQTLDQDGVNFSGPASGEMAEKGESGTGRMSEVADIVRAAAACITPKIGSLSGRRIIVTAGPTHEPIDPVRYIANRSSGKQGYAIAEALAARGAEVKLVSGPVKLHAAPGIELINVKTADEMLAAVEGCLPADAAVMVAAVADWRPASPKTSKMKKDRDGTPAALQLVENPDILATVSHHANRPDLVVGFAAETDDLIANAQRKLQRKGCDLIVANDVSVNAEGQSVMGGDRNKVQLISRDGVVAWEQMSKSQVASQLADWIVERVVADD